MNNPTLSRRAVLTALASLTLPTLPASAGTLPLAVVERRLRALVERFDGRVGISVQDRSGIVGVNRDQRFSLQSVMKLIVAMATLDAVDRRGWRLNEPILVRKQDLSLNVQPLAKLVTDNGYRTTRADLVFRAVVDSDSAATDILFAQLGGAATISDFLKRNGITGVRVDRDERHLQTETSGLTWKPEYVDPAVLARARKAVPPAAQEAAFRAYLTDPRDSATPDGMTALLYRLATGKLLSPPSTRYLLTVMRQTATSPGRLKAGTPPGWQLGHKTGTSDTWHGLNGTSNDVGILTAPDNSPLAISVFVAESRRSPESRDALIAAIARTVTSAYVLR